MPTASDAELIEAHVHGDPQAFAELVRRHRDRMWSVALRTMRNYEDAADALQEALLSAFRGAAQFRGQSQVSTWLHRIVVNACLDRIRRRQARPTVSLAEGAHVDPVATTESADDRDTRLTVDHALAELPVEQRAAIVLVDLHGYPVSEAATILDTAEGTVKSRCARGRVKLAKLLGHLRNPNEVARVSSSDRAITPHHQEAP